eukprot:357274-Chlamydomonas_euryale.AAC.4
MATFSVQTCAIELLHRALAFPKGLVPGEVLSQMLVEANRIQGIIPCTHAQVMDCLMLRKEQMHLMVDKTTRETGRMCKVITVNDMSHVTMATVSMKLRLLGGLHAGPECGVFLIVSKCFDAARVADWALKLRTDSSDWHAVVHMCALAAMR